MAAKLLHSLTDDNPDLQNQIGCMTGIFQLFDRQHMFNGQRPKRLLPGTSRFSTGIVEREDGNSYHRFAALEKYNSNKNMQERQRLSTESSRASFSSASRSSSFSSLDCNQITQLEPSALDRTVFPETPSRESVKTLPSSPQQFSRQAFDLRDVVKDSMYREVNGGLSVRAKTVEEAAGSTVKDRVSLRPLPKVSNVSHDSGLNLRQNLPADVKESLSALAKLQEAPWYNNEHRQLLRSSSYHSKDGSSFSVDAPRFSYDGREMNRAPRESRDSSKPTPKLKDLPRLSLDSREGSMRSSNADSRSKFFSEALQEIGDFDGNVKSLQLISESQARPPSVVAKLMGLDTLPGVISPSEQNMGQIRTYPGEDVNVSRPSTKIDPRKSIQLSSSSKSLWKEPSSPRWRNPDAVMKPMTRFPIEPAPWKQSDGTRGPQKQTLRSMRNPEKTPNTLPSVYSKIEKRLKDLQFHESGKDLRALKQILEAIQAKRLLEEGQDSNFTSHKDDELVHTSLMHEARSSTNQNRQSDQILASVNKRGNSLRSYESPIVIMKPAKLVEKSGIPVSSVVSVNGLSDLPKLRGAELADSRKGVNSGRLAKDFVSKTSSKDRAVNSVSNRRESRSLKTTQTPTRSQQSPKDIPAGSKSNLVSNSPTIQKKKLNLDKKCLPPTPPDSGKSRIQSNRQQVESNSPDGRRRPKQPSLQQIDDQLTEVTSELRKLSYLNDEMTGESNENILLHTQNEQVIPVLPGTASSQSPPTEAVRLLNPGIGEKKSSLLISEEESVEYARLPPEYPSPVSVLYAAVCSDDSPVPVKHIKKNLKVYITADGSMDSDGISSAEHSSPVDDFIAHSMEPGTTPGINRKKLRSIENLVQKLTRLNSSHDEARTDYIASLCEYPDPDHRYISEILLASGLLLRDLGSSLTTFQFHQSGYPINPQLFLVLEQTKASTLQKDEFGTAKKRESLPKEKLHRKLIFDAVNEILAEKLALAEPSTEPWLRPAKLAKKALNAQKLLRELCSDIEGLQTKSSKYSSDDDSDGLKVILCEDVTQCSDSWSNFSSEIPVIVLDVERLIFKDLVAEIVIGEEVTGLRTKAVKRRQLF